MSVRTICVVALAVICGISAAVGMSRMRRTGTTAEVAPPETTQVVVAKEGISKFRLVTELDLEMKPWPKAMIPEGAITTKELATDRVAIMRIMPGEPILDAKLAPKGTSDGLEIVIPKGMRAYAIPTSRAAASVAGFVQPGNKVDVLLNLKTRANAKDDETGGAITSTLLQAVEILAVDQRVDSSAEKKGNPRETSSVTLLVTPKQAALLDLGQNMGQLTLSLRNPEDKSEAGADPATLAGILFQQEKPLGSMEAGAASPGGSILEKLAAASNPRPKTPEAYDIATLRGNHWGRVRVVSNR